jgi:hypothetical protein
MTIEHSEIADPDIHEPKGVASAAANEVYASNGVGGGSWTKLNEVDNLDFSVAAKNKFGWNDVADSLYTSGAPRAITSGTRTKITNNASASQTDITRLGSIWSTTNNNFLINDLNAFYTIRLSFKCTAAAAAGTPYLALIELESANGPTIISSQTQYVKGGGAVNGVSVSIPVYIGSFINNQTLSLYVTPDTAMNFYDFGFVVQRTYSES